MDEPARCVNVSCRTLAAGRTPTLADRRHARAGKITLYKVNDPFLAFWFRFVEPNRSRLGAGAVPSVAKEIRSELPQHTGAIWEQMVCNAVPRLGLHGKEWQPASRWWGAGTDRQPLELDLVAESADHRALLVGEVKLRISAHERPRIETQLRSKIKRLPFASRYPEIFHTVFVVGHAAEKPENDARVTAAKVVPALV